VPDPLGDVECLTGYRNLIMTFDGLKEADKTLLDG
jgi:hypothetical protein